ncbi:protein TORNADO 2-like [Rhododendron vialii]|uniref:protein TORNADO 2-like n=1 Tax=Rhododendron vialii TaxID=182163 RepID=UPI00265F89C7|nr:protein TORNADO 2-like [Rhododendron vialii]
MATEISPEQGVHIFFVTVSAIPMVLSGYFVLKNVSFLGQKPDCTDPHSGWDLAFGFFLFTLFLLGTLSLAWRVTALQIACMALLVLTMALIGGVSRNVLFGGNEPKDSKKIEEYYRLETYPSWSQKFLLKDNDWRAFQNCIIERKVCDDVDKEGIFQGGCCVPPIYCGFQQKNQTWVIPESGLYSDDANCVMWSSENGKLCYNCDTCKASYIHNFAFKWYMRGDDQMYAVLVWIFCFGLTYAIEKENSQRRNRTVQSTA